MSDWAQETPTFTRWWSPQNTWIPSLRSVRVNPKIDSVIAIAVVPQVTADRSSTNERSDEFKSSQSTTPEFKSSVIAQRYDTRTKN